MSAVRTIRLATVRVSDSAIMHVSDLLRAGVVGQSAVIEDFERAFARWCDVAEAVAVSSGTMADMIALAVLKHQYPGKTEVVMPALTFAAQLNAVLHNGLTPVFVDHGADDRPLITTRTLCRFPVHVLGRPTVWHDVPDVPVIEDACEALGSRFGQRPCGLMGSAMGTFSFFPSHTMTTGEGGMIVTYSKELARLARRLRNHGKMAGADQVFHFDVVGFNGKMTSLQAALGLGALPGLQDAISRRRQHFLALGGREAAGEFICAHGVPFLAKSEAARDTALSRLQEAGIECRNLFSCLPTQEPAYAFLGYQLGDFPVAEMLGRLGFYVPCHQDLSEADVAYVRAQVAALPSLVEAA